MGTSDDLDKEELRLQSGKSKRGVKIREEQKKKEQHKSVRAALK